MLYSEVAMGKIPADIKKLDEQINRLKQKEKSHRQAPDESEYAHAAKTGFRVGTELVSGVIVGAAIGWLLDLWLNTQPWFLVIFLFFGGAAGFLNVYRFVRAEESREK